MRLPFLRSKDPAAERTHPPTSPGVDGALLQAARTRARQRLVGALVLLAVGVIGFPILFETQPRPLSPDTPIEVTPSPGAPAPRPVTSPAARPAPLKLPPVDAGEEVAPAASAPAVLAAAPAPASAASAPRPVPAPVPPTVATAAVPPVVARPAASAPPRAAAPAPAASVAAPRAVAATEPRADDAARARSLLAGQAASAPAAGRFVVQAGAYTDAASLREARAKAEKLGFKTYTQVIEGDAGKRTRVRVGPFATRQEAEAAAARIKGAGLPTAVLTL